MDEANATPDGDDRTFHLTPAEVWQRQRTAASYWPEAYERDGFIHCTTGVSNLLAVGNCFYRDDPRPYLALELTLGALDSPVKREDSAGIYPHIYGPLNRVAVTAVRPVFRASDGEFVAVGQPVSPAEMRQERGTRQHE